MIAEGVSEDQQTRHLPAPTGHNKKAQGDQPWVNGNQNYSALKGRNNHQHIKFNTSNFQIDNESILEELLKMDSMAFVAESDACRR